MLRRTYYDFSDMELAVLIATLESILGDESGEVVEGDYLKSKHAGIAALEIIYDKLVVVNDLVSADRKPSKTSKSAEDGRNKNT